MSDNFLSQNDVDSLFGNQTGEVETVKPIDTGPRDGVRPYDLSSKERIVRGRMPTLEMMHEKFSTQLRIGLAAYLHKSIEVSVGEVKFIKYSEFLRNLVVPTSLNLVQISPFSGTAMIVVEPTLMFHFVDHLFGGNGRIHTRVEGREFTETERRIIHRVLGIIYDHYEKAWEPIHPIKFDFIRSEMNTKFANITSPNEIVIATEFAIDMGTGSGRIHMCIPYSMIEPVRELLAASMQGEPPKADKQWTKTLTHQVHATEVDVRAQLGTAKLTLKQIMNLEVGDVIPMSVLPTLVASADGVPIWSCSYGTSQGKYAIKVEQVLTPPNDRLDPSEMESQLAA
jgi:flagellar motor switch protein FliM